MRIERVEPRHTFSIYLPTSLYQKLVDKAGRGRVSTFIKQVLEKELEEETSFTPYFGFKKLSTG